LRSSDSLQAYKARYSHDPSDYKDSNGKDLMIQPFVLRFLDGTSQTTYRVIEGEQGAWEMTTADVREAQCEQAVDNGDMTFLHKQQGIAMERRSGIQS